MFLISGGENFWKTLWIVVLFVIFVVPNLEYIRALWGYATGVVADGIESQAWEQKQPIDTIYAFLRKQQRNAYYAQYDSMYKAYVELSISARKLSTIPPINEQFKLYGVEGLFMRAHAAVQKFLTDQRAEFVTEAKSYLERIESIIRDIARPWLAGWLVMVGLVGLILGTRQKRDEDLDGSVPTEMIQRSRFGIVRSYILPSSILTLWYFWQFDPYFSMFGFYFMVPLTVLWFFIPYVGAKASV